MTQRTVTRRFYQLQCDQCGELGPEDFFFQEAVQRARAKGWWNRSHYDRLRRTYVSEDLCPSCAQRVEDEQRREDLAEQVEQAHLVTVGMG